MFRHCRQCATHNHLSLRACRYINSFRETRKRVRPDWRSDARAAGWRLSNWIKLDAEPPARTSQQRAPGSSWAGRQQTNRPSSFIHKRAKDPAKDGCALMMLPSASKWCWRLASAMISRRLSKIVIDLATSQSEWASPVYRDVPFHIVKSVDMALNDAQQASLSSITGPSDWARAGQLRKLVGRLLMRLQAHHLFAPIGQHF